jgi:hypothetical protein
VVVEQVDVEKLVGELELAVDRLRSLYEQYFMGIEKLEPTVPRKDVDRRIHVLRKEQIRNTAQRFRFQMILQRYSTYQSYWQRICREIENGTYKRHLIRANLRFADGRASRPPSRRPPPPSHPPASSRPPPSSRPSSRPQPGAALPAHLAAELAELDREFAPRAPQAARSTPLRAPVPLIAPIPRHAPAPGAPAHTRSIQPPAAADPAPAATAPPAKAPPPPRSRSHSQRRDDELSEERLRQLYAQYVEARRRQNEPTTAVTFETVAKNLRESSLRLRERHGRSIDFEVAVKDGRAVLKPVLK